MKRLRILIFLLCLTACFALVGCENKNKYSLSAPSNLEVENGQIIFDAVDGADYYTIIINNFSLNLDAKTDKNVSLVNNQVVFNANQIFVIGESYSIKVVAKSTSKADSSESGTVSYIHSAYLTVPENVVCDGDNMILSWQAVANASCYKVKVVTPNTVLFDQDGNKLVGRDSATVEKATIPEYTYPTNTFDFSSLVSVAGNYYFYVRAVYSDGGVVNQSDYSNPETFFYSQKLETPSICSVAFVDGDLIMSAIVDRNSNCAQISCDGVSKQQLLDTADVNVFEDDNMVEFNLTKMFKNVFDFSVSKSRHEFGLCLLSLNTSEYIQSGASAQYVFEKKDKLDSPVISLSTNGKFLSIENPNENSSTRVAVLRTMGNLEFVDIGASNGFEISGDYIAITAQAIGGDLVESSEYAVPVVFGKQAEYVDQEISRTGGQLSWKETTGAKYLILYNGKIVATTSPFVQVEKTTLKEDFVVCAISDKFEYSSYSIQAKIKLEAPKISSSQGFSSSNPYLFSFTPVENAIGYRLHIKSFDNQSSNSILIERDINKIFLSNEINISPFIDANMSNEYEISVKAIASPYGIYLDSDCSQDVAFTHTRVLDKPVWFVENSPIIKKIENQQAKYYLSFYGVADAESYEYRINGYTREFKPTSNVANMLYQLDVTIYLGEGMQNSVKLRAIANKSASNVLNSDFISGSYTMQMQLEPVKNVQITEKENKFVLSFDLSNKAGSYWIRVIKLNDSNYAEYLRFYGLTNEFELTDSTFTFPERYFIEKGEYYVYVTALPYKNAEQYYAQSNESSANFATIAGLLKPTNITITNKDATNIELSWTGDDNADSYKIRLTDAYNLTYEISVPKLTTSLNINKYFTRQGDYDIEIFSIANATNSSYKSSGGAKIEQPYHFRYSKYHDFVRANCTINQITQNYVVSSAGQLKNLLWYNYVYELDRVDGMAFYLELETKEDNTKETIREAIYRLATQAESEKIYYFSLDQVWLNQYYKKLGKTDNQVMQYVCEKLLSVYPDLHILTDFEIMPKDDLGQIFRLYFRNALNQEKTKNYANTDVVDFVPGFDYLPVSARRNENTAFAIDFVTNQAMVETTEQLLLAVRNGQKPVFFGNCEIAQTVYNNARSVLSKIITDRMTDLEKTTAIFNWLEYALNLNENVDSRETLTGYEPLEKSVYGLIEDYYLEGVFAHLNTTAQGEEIFDGEFNLRNKMATSYSYAKAFNLLCAIDGVECVTVYGEYNFKNNNQNYSGSHAYNKVNIATGIDQSDKAWYVVDVTYSDNLKFSNNTTIDSNKTPISVGAHTYFLVQDSVLQGNLGMKENTNIISNTYLSDHACNTSFDYYSNSTFGLSKDQLDQIPGMKEFGGEYSGFEYILVYQPDYAGGYQTYDLARYGDNIQIYLYNLMLVALQNADKFDSDYVSIEFRAEGLAGDYINAIHNVLDRNTSSLFMTLKRGKTSIYLETDTINQTFVVLLERSTNKNASTNQTIIDED